MRRGRLAVVVAAALLVASCGGSPAAAPDPSGATVGTTSPSPDPTPQSSPATPSASPTPSSPATTAPGAAGPATKLLVLVVENHSLDAMRREMPATFALAQRYGYALGYRALSHPSLPNYLAFTGGDTEGITDDRDPAAHPLSGPSVFGRALAAGRTARTYAEGMTRTCQTANAGRYAVRHNPWAYHVGERAACARFDVPLTALAGDVASGSLPDAGLVVPDTCHDAHDCPAGVADGWLSDELDLVMSGPDWTAGRLVVVVTADEDDHDQDNRVLTVVLSPQLSGRVVTEPLTHYSLARLYAEVTGVEPLGHAREAASMARAFGLRVGPAA